MIRILHLLVLSIIVLSTINAQEKSERAILSIVKNEIATQFTKNELNSLEITITDYHKSKQSQLDHYYFRQTTNGIQMFGSESSVHLKTDGSIHRLNNHLVSGVGQTKQPSITPAIDPLQAIQSVGNHLGYTNIGKLEVTNHSVTKDRSQTISKGAISKHEIPTRLMYFLDENKELTLAWDLSIHETQQEQSWSFLVDATTGKILNQISWTLTCNFNDSNHDCSAHHKHDLNLDLPAKEVESSTNNNNFVGGYRVYGMPIPHPDQGQRSFVNDPDNSVASPYGWHDTNGSNGAEFTTTRGNNVNAYDNASGYKPDGGGSLQFDFPLDLNQNPQNYRDAAITNLFYWNNIAHDVLYQYGFDESSGNFQQNNYGKGGSGNDYVNARSQVGQLCNATFQTNVDGNTPTMSMYICNGRDGNFSNAVVLHEYGHGLSFRLVGGANNINCLGNDEQMGEGWSDFVGLVFTMTASDQGANARPIGEWLFNDPVGIRPYPYSTSNSVNPQTYASSFSGTSVPHGIGSVWCTMLWDMTWAMIDKHGFDADVYNGSGGNNVALQLVVEGLKLTACNPGFVDARDAILSADQALYNGDNKCEIWEVFADRGLGENASQGSSSNRADGTENFDVPSTCISSCGLTFGGGNSVNLPYQASNNNVVNIQTIVNIPWTATSTASWIALLTTSGTGNGTITYNISQNNDAAPRSGQIKVTCDGTTETYTIYQDIYNCELKFVGGNSTSFPPTASTNNALNVESIANAAWSATTTATWITLINASGTGNGTITYDVAQNNDALPRSATIDVSCDDGGISTFTVQQRAECKTDALEAFDYADGTDIGGASGGSGYSGGWTTTATSGSFQVVSGSLPFGNFTGSGNKLKMDMQNEGATNSIIRDLEVPVYRGNEVWISCHVKPLAFAFAGGFLIEPNGDPNIGFGKQLLGNEIGFFNVPSAISFEIDSIYKLVVRYKLEAGGTVAHLWINKNDDFTDASAAVTNSTPEITEVNSIRITVDKFFGNIALEIDELYVGCSPPELTCNTDFDVALVLEGPYDQTTGEMTTALYDLQYLPITQPYNTAPWNYPGTEGTGLSLADFPMNSVDWLLVSLRTDVASSTEVVKAAAMLLSDGSLFFPDCVNVPDGSYYIAIEHRNHMGVLSSTKVTVSNNALTYDFTAQNSYSNGVGVGQKDISGKWVMLGGDYDQSDAPSYDINGSDKLIWQAENGTFGTYTIPDGDLNGDVNGNDNIEWDKNSGTFSSVPK